MRAIHMIAVWLLTASPLAAISAAPENLTSTFTALENAFARGYQEKDVAVLEALLAPEYALVISARPSHPVSRPEWLALIPNYNVRSFEIRDIQVRCLRESPRGKCQLAAVSSINKQEADVGGQDRSGEFFIVDIWARRNGRWAVLSRYSGRTEIGVPKLMDNK